MINTYKSVRCSMRKCGVECLVVLDGAYDSSEIKLKTVMTRMREQAGSAVRTTLATQKRNKVMPIFGKGTKCSS